RRGGLGGGDPGMTSHRRFPRSLPLSPVSNLARRDESVSTYKAPASPPLPPLRKHWYLHNLCSSEELNCVCEPSEVVEVVMFKQSKHRQHDPETGQKRRGGVRAIPFHLAAAQADQDLLQFHGLRRV